MTRRTTRDTRRCPHVREMPDGDAPGDRTRTRRARGPARSVGRGRGRCRTETGSETGTDVAPVTSRPAYAVTTRRAPSFRVAVWTGVAGILAYNWWVLVPLDHGLMRSPNELFSDLEATGQPFAGAMRTADFVSGALLVTAFLLLNSGAIGALRREWTAMVVFAVAGSAGAIFPESCADGISNACRAAEIRFQLPVRR